MDAIKVWHGLPATFTPPDSLGKPVPFEHRHERYMNVAEVMVTLASASLVFVPSSRLSLYSHACAFALILLGLCVLYSVGFMALMTYFYVRGPRLEILISNIACLAFRLVTAGRLRRLPL